jgi:hypothetical protein
MSKLSIHRPEEKKEGAPLTGVPERLAGKAGEAPRKPEKKAEAKVAAPKEGPLTGVPERLAGEMDGKCKCGCKGKKGDGEKKTSVGKKIVKFFVWLVVGLLAFVGILVASSPLWIGPVVTTAANSIVPKLTGTEFSLQEFGFNIYNGKLHVGGVNLANPKGYEPETAVSVGSLDVDVDMSTVLSKRIVISDIGVTNVFVSVVNDDEGIGNFEAIAANAAGPDAGNAEAKPELTEEEKAEKKKNATKVEIDRLDVEGLTVQYKAVKLPVPLPTLTDIGKESDMDWEDAWNQIVTAVVNSLGNIGEGLKNVGKGIADGAKESAEAMKEGAKAVKEGAGKAIDAAGESLKDVGSAIKGLFK